MCAALAVIMAACGSPVDDVGTTAQEALLCADVVGVVIDTGADGVARFDVTVSSDDLGWEAYADRWEVVAGGSIVAERVLTHPHVEEQPFTRSLGGIDLPDGPITVRAHHSTGGFCGEEFVVER